ncbi:MAG: cytochrome b [Parvibaculum sp.]|nr:cytochrome b [Parvibaculum sp.]
MQLSNTENRYGLVTIALHWVLAGLFLAQMGVGIAMTNLPLTDPMTFPLYQSHKSIGALIFVLATSRLVWRFISAPPPLPAAMPKWQVRAAHLTHYGLYFALLAMPLLGWVIVSASPYGIPTLLFGLIDLPHLGFVVASPAKAEIGAAASLAHFLLAWAAGLLLLGHAAAALAHHFWLKDDILTRMWPTRSHFRRGNK